VLPSKSSRIYLFEVPAMMYKRTILRILFYKTTFIGIIVLYSILPKGEKMTEKNIPTEIRCKATASLQKEVEEDLKVKDPSPEQAKAILKKAENETS